VPALALCAIFVSLAGLHFFWALGGRAGIEGVVPQENSQPLLIPRKAATVLVAFLLLAAAGVSLWRGLEPNARSYWVPYSGTWVIALLFAVRAIGDFRYVGFFKRVRGTTFARNDSLVFSPLCAVISGLAIWLASGY
jgi:hypothetical protein